MKKLSEVFMALKKTYHTKTRNNIQQTLQWHVLASKEPPSHPMSDVSSSNVVEDREPPFSSFFPVGEATGRRGMFHLNAQKVTHKHTQKHNMTIFLLTRKLDLLLGRQVKN